MNKSVTSGIAVIIFFFAATGSANAVSAKSPDQFQAMISSIHAKQQLQRNALMQKIKLVNSIDAQKNRPGKKMSLKLLALVEGIQAKQAVNRLKIMEFVNNNLKKQAQVASNKK